MASCHFTKTDLLSQNKTDGAYEVYELTTSVQQGEISVSKRRLSENEERCIFNIYTQTLDNNGSSWYVILFA